MIAIAAENSSSSYNPTVYTVLLTGMCLLLALFLLTRLLVALRNKNKLLAWSTGFYVLCLLWTGVRSAYWVIMLTQESMRYLTLYLLYWSPTPIQFANFSLLILFYIQVLTGPEWRSRWRNVCLPLYLLLTMTMATFTVVWAFNSSNDISKATRRGDEYDQEFSRVSDVSVQLKYSAASFFLLSGKLEEKEAAPFKAKELGGDQFTAVLYLLHTRNSGSSHVAELVPEHLE
ncbi:hypothetical protein BBJ29_006793 [Phytophthora kernoviae]|uniref:Uncharacterized protein n=1 Tax=Phytophthora kernoviae TaxID=325452 RepID=A0A3F2RHD3_9STRA|nr:hypothetical protein BBP00_00008456 [Phytophthora kernoviae]RLN70353.1 hypothetical protein BBJ29_006793 [Phytophthora kernoviae]